MIVLPHSSADSSSSSFPDMTALLDVIFILLVFLLLTANTATEIFDIDLPNDAGSQTRIAEIDKQITLTLFAETDKWGIEGQQFSDWLAFQTAFKQRIQHMDAPEVIVAGDRQASLEKTLKLLAFLQENKLSAAQILVSPTVAPKQISPFSD